MKSNRKTFGIVIIGNEILSGKTLDTNSHLICSELNNVGMVCKEIVTIPDVEKIISEKVNFFRQKFDLFLQLVGLVQLMMIKLLTQFQALLVTH